MRVGAGAREAADLDARARIGTAVDVVRVGQGNRREVGAAGEQRGECGEAESAIPQVSLPSVRSFCTTAQPSVSVTLAATTALMAFP